LKNLYSAGAHSYLLCHTTYLFIHPRNPRCSQLG
jgi:hypothetical protein